MPRFYRIALYRVRVTLRAANPPFADPEEEIIMAIERIPTREIAMFDVTIKKATGNNQFVGTATAARADGAAKTYTLGSNASIAGFLRHLADELDRSK